MNINKLLPRFSIRLKLAIAFALLSLIPLAIVGTVGTRVNVDNIRNHARSTLEHDLEIARQRTEHSLKEIERSLQYVASLLLDDGRWPGSSGNDVKRSLTTFVDLSPALFQVRAFDERGELTFLVRGDEAEVTAETESEAGGIFYALRGKQLATGQNLMLPMELRGAERLDGVVSTIPALAFLLPLRDAGGSFHGVLVGEAFASELFGALEGGSPHLAGVTGLVDAEGLFLYHSERKSNWANLLASRAEADLTREFTSDVAQRILSGEAGTVLAEGLIVSYLPIDLNRPGMSPLFLYMAVSLADLQAPARRFIGSVALGAVAVLVVVLGLAFLAAHQFTRPIYRLRRGARRLAQGLSDAPVEVATNDELEDLATDFSKMARLLSEQHQHLEGLVEARTKELCEAHAELAGILEHSADAIVGLDLDGHVRIWNRGAESLFGFTDAEARNRDVDSLILPDGDKWRAEAAFVRREAAVKEAVVNFQTRRTSRDGKEFPVSLTQTVIRDEQDRPLGYSLIIRDTRLQTKLEQQMRHSERLAAMSVLAAGVAHELGNPLAVITNRVECMERELRSRSNGEFLGDDLAVLREHAERLDAVIKDLLTLGEEEGEASQRIRLNEVAERVIRLLDRTYQARDVKIEEEFATDVPALRGSPEAVATVCMNLLLNAIDATPPGGQIVVATRCCKGCTGAELEVRDTGPGIPTEIRHRIFEPFFTTKGAGHGTGLGLAVCHTIVERHGGEIRVDSEPGRGTRFVVCLPIEASGKQWMSNAFS
ncbi:MAG: sensor histidine kinase [Planctomycetota bacterium]|jgi:PAS domain S-box-containing protein